ncbi:unnamed protein product [Choristocarpus tenellus]
MQYFARMCKDVLAGEGVSLLGEDTPQGREMKNIVKAAVHIFSEEAATRLTCDMLSLSYVVGIATFPEE